MKRIETIKEKKEFNNIIKKEKFIKNKLYVIYIKKRNDDLIKYGIAVSKKLGKAHIRNKLKRQTRSIIDNNKNLFKKGNNYIIMLRKDIALSNFKEMNDAMLNILKK